MFDKKYPDLIEDIIDYIAPNPTNPTQESMVDINDWWDY
jgi:hypothetical protein